MTVVTRHNVDMAFTEDMVKRSVENEKLALGFVRARPRPSSLVDVFDDSLNHARRWSFFDENGESERMLHSLQLAAHAGTALFAAAAISEGSVQVWLDGPIEVPASPNTSLTGVGIWLHTFYLATILKDTDLIDQLAAIPRPVLGVGSDRCFFDWVATLQSFWRSDGEFHNKLAATKTAIAQRKITPLRFLNLILVPQVELCQAIQSMDSERFNEALTAALLAHKKYFNTPKNRHDPEGFLSLPAIAFASLARHHGMTINTASPYMPEHLTTLTSSTLPT